MVEVDHVDRRDGAVGEVKVRRHADDPPVRGGFGDAAREGDAVLAGADRPPTSKWRRCAPFGTGLVTIGTLLGFAPAPGEAAAGVAIAATATNAAAALASSRKRLCTQAT